MEQERMICRTVSHRILCRDRVARVKVKFSNKSLDLWGQDGKTVTVGYFHPFSESLHDGRHKMPAKGSRLGSVSSAILLRLQVSKLSGNTDDVPPILAATRALDTSGSRALRSI